MNDVRYINPSCLAAPTGNFSWAAQSEKTVYLSGVVGIDRAGKVVPGDAEAQARQIYDNLEATLKELGGDLNSLVRTRIYVVGRENLAKHRRARKAVIDAGRMTIRPVSTLLLVAGLAEEDWLVEIDADAILP